MLPIGQIKISESEFLKVHITKKAGRLLFDIGSGTWRRQPNPGLRSRPRRGSNWAPKPSLTSSASCRGPWRRPGKSKSSEHKK